MTFIWAAIKEFFRPVRWPDPVDASVLKSVHIKGRDGKWYKFEKVDDTSLG